MANFFASYPIEGSGGGGVTTINGLSGAVILAAGTDIIISPSGNTLTIGVVGGNLTDVGTDGIVITNGTGAVLGSGTQIAQHVADATHNGYLSSADWNSFSATSANAITALTGDGTAVGPGSAVFTLATVNGNVGSFGSSTSIPSFTVNAKGLITAASGNVVIAPAGTLTGTTLASNVVTSSLTSLGTQAADLNMGSHFITNLLDPTTSQEAATKNYVDIALAALQPAAAVYAATTVNLVGTYSNGVAGVGAAIAITATGTFTLDGTTPPQGSRILVKDQTTGFQNGIYDLTAAGSVGISPVLTRSADYNTSADMNSAGLIPVLNGTINSVTSWQQVAHITTVGTDALVFTEFTANPSLYLLKTNNLSDVASASAAFNNISPLTTLGDTLYASGVNTNARLSGNTTTTKQFLTQTGTGAVSAAPAWDILAPTDLPTITLTGDVTGASAGGSIATTIANNVITNAKLAQVPTLTIKGNNTGGAANVADLTVVQVNAILPVFTSTLNGLVPFSGGGTTNFLRADGTWATATATNYNVVTKTTTYAATSSDNVILVDDSGGSWTLTLPTAVGISGHVFIIKKTNSSMANSVTIATTSAQTIDGNASSFYKLNTQNESYELFSDGANWQIDVHKTLTDTTTYTPTFVGFGTVTNLTVFWLRRGDLLKVQGYGQTGTTTGVPAQIGLPTNLAIDTAKLPNANHLVGNFCPMNPSATGTQIPNISWGPWPMVYVPGNSNPTLNVSFAGHVQGNNLDDEQGLALANNANFSFEFEVPIAGWQA